MIPIKMFKQITWNDAVVFGPNTKNVATLSVLTTRGVIAKETEKYIIIGNPITTRKDGSLHPKIRPRYYLIPKSMIISIESGSS